MSAERPKMTKTKKKQSEDQTGDDFESVARRLGCDEDKESFEKKLGKIARAKIPVDDKK
jgi:hypothetical protein